MSGANDDVQRGLAGRLRRGLRGLTHPVVVVGLLMVAVQLVFRAWAVYGSWFYGDDVEYLSVAVRDPFGWDYLTLPHGGHLLPMTRLLAAAVAGPDNVLHWSIAATQIVLLQGLASAAALWMFLSVFGRRWAALAPLALYLTSAITVPAMIWWAAALNQLGHQAGLFLAVGAWIHYERRHHRGWLLVVAGGVVLSLLCDARGLFIPPLLAMLSVGWFAHGSLNSRIVEVLRRHWLPAGALVVLSAAYWISYTATAQEDLTQGAGRRLAGNLFDTMIGTAFGSGIVGGPWRWDTSSPPTSYADPPQWAAHFAWVVIVVVILHSFLTRDRVMRAYAMAGTYLAALFVMVLISRAPVAGARIGLEYRYLTDAAPIIALALALAYLSLPGSEQSSAPRAHPLFTPVVSPAIATALVAAVSISGLGSSFTYIRHFQKPSREAARFVDTYRDQVDRSAPVDLVDTGLPGGVVTPLTWPKDALPRLTALMGVDARFPDATDRLGMVASDGTLDTVLIKQATTSNPGPLPGCGWRVTSGSVRIPLQAEVFEWPWWIRIGYLAPDSSPVTVRAGDSVVRTEIKRGLNSLYVKAEGSYDSVLISGIDRAMTVCVDTVEVGVPEAGTELK